METIEVKINGKWPIKMPQHRAKRPEWYTEQGWERKRLDSMSENIGKGDVVYYVGAELGEMPALCQMWGAEVALFEPNYLSWPVIKAVWEANKLSRPPYLFAGFASDTTKVIPENPDKDLYKGIGWTNGEDDWPIFSQGEIVEAHGFSELVHEANGLPQVKIDDVYTQSPKFNKPPTAICLDVEGSEGCVLRGAEQTLIKYRPKIWLSLHPEFLHEQYGEWGAELRQWIMGLGYKETLIDYPLHECHLYYCNE